MIKTKTAISGFSFIGIGLGDNVIDWGGMVSEAREVVIARPTLMIYPVVLIVICTLLFNMIVDRGGKTEETHVTN